MNLYDNVQETFTKHDIRYIYGIPGEGILDLLNCLAEGPIHFVSARQMWAAAYMATGEAWATGRPALCAAGDAYGVELIRPLRDAKRHQIPLVVLASGDWIPLLDPVVKQRFAASGLGTAGFTASGLNTSELDTADKGEWAGLIEPAMKEAAREPAGPVLITLPGSANVPEFKGAGDPESTQNQTPEGESISGIQKTRASLIEKDQFTSGSDFPPTPIPIFEALQHILTPNDLILCEGGLVSLWAERFLEPLKAGKLFLPPLGFTPGAAFPASLGAHLGHPDGRVIVITDDASYNTSVLEIETMRRMGAPIVTLVFRSSRWEWAHIQQEQRYERSAFVEYRCPNLIRLTQVAGGKGFRLERGDSFESHLEHAFALKGPVTIDCPVDMRGAKKFI